MEELIAKEKVLLEKENEFGALSKEMDKLNKSI